ncbi:hypothetical protein PPUN110474_38730 [Pseudomonas putida]|nr:hypothetical protein PPUN110474_38730 [Pseudomonas putida]
MQQSYVITIRDLFTVHNDVQCGGRAVVSIMDGGKEIDQLLFEGKVGPEGYQRRYSGKPGLKANIVSGPGSISFASAH